MALPCEVRDGELTEGEGARGHETKTFMIKEENMAITTGFSLCLLYTSPSPRD